MTDEPNVRLELAATAYPPQGELAGAFVIAGGPPPDTRSVELSVLWRTSGKGTEDIGVVHYRAWTGRRHPRGDAEPEHLRGHPAADPVELRRGAGQGPLARPGAGAVGGAGRTRELVRDAEFTLAPAARS